MPTGATVANGGMLSPAIVSQYAASLDGLTESQARLALSSLSLGESQAKLNEAQIEQVLTAAGLKTATEEVSTSEVEAMVASRTLTEAKREEILATLEGALSEEGWNKEKLEAIALEGGEAGAIAAEILAKQAEVVADGGLIVSGKIRNTLIKERIALMLQEMALNPAVWIIGLVAAVVALVAIQEKLSKSLEESIENTKKANDAYSKSSKEIESLTSELETCKTRLKELQTLADNGTISVVEQEELNRLKGENDELERQLKVEKELAAINAQKALNEANEGVGKTEKSRYKRGTNYNDVGEYEDYAQVTVDEELDEAIKAYKKLEVEIENLNDAYDNGTISSEEYNQKLRDLEERQVNARDYAKEVFDQVNEFNTAYKNAENAGIELTRQEIENYSNMKAAAEDYYNFLDLVSNNGPKSDADSAVESQANRIATSSTADETDRKDVYDHLIAQTEGFSDEEKATWAEAIKDAKNYQEAVERGEKAVQKLRNAQQGLNANSAFDQEKFSEQVNELDALQSAYEKFVSNVNDEDATKINLDISDVEALREKFGEINGFDFDDFEITVTSDTSGVKEIQDAFDEALTAYANTKIELKGISEETENMVRTQLEMEGATKESAESFTEFYMAINNAEEAEAELISLTTTATQAGSDLSNVTAQEIAELEAEGQVAPATAQALAVLALQKQLAAGITFGEQGNIDQIMALASAAKVGAKYLNMLASAKSLAAQIDAGDTTAATAQRLKALTDQIEAYDWQSDVDMSLNFDFSKAGGGKSAAGSAGSAAGDAYVQAFEDELAKLDDAYNQGKQFALAA